MKALDIDGEVMEVGLHRVKVKAWDNTITTFPTSKFLELTFKDFPVRGFIDLTELKSYTPKLFL